MKDVFIFDACALIAFLTDEEVIHFSWRGFSPSSPHRAHRAP